MTKVPKGWSATTHPCPECRTGQDEGVYLTTDMKMLSCLYCQWFCILNKGEVAKVVFKTNVEVTK